MSLTLITMSSIITGNYLDDTLTCMIRILSSQPRFVFVYLFTTRRTKHTQVQPADDDGRPLCLLFSVVTFDYTSFGEIPNPWNCHSEIIWRQHQVCGPASSLNYLGCAILRFKRKRNGLNVFFCPWSTHGSKIGEDMKTI